MKIVKRLFENEFCANAFMYLVLAVLCFALGVVMGILAITTPIGQ